MTLLAWVTIYLVVSTVGALTGPFLQDSFPWNVTAGAPRDSRAMLFLRILFSSLLFGAIVGLPAGLITMAVARWLPHAV